MQKLLFGDPKARRPRGLRKKARPEKVIYAKKMRKNPTETETMLWQRLRRRQCKGLRFRRQAIVLGWITDFYCPELRLVLEVDGSSHLGQDKRDGERDRVMARNGISVLRLEAKLVEADIDGAVTVIEDVIRTLRERYSTALEQTKGDNDSPQRPAREVRRVK